MKKIIVIIFAILILAACGSNEADSSNNEDETDERKIEIDEEMKIDNVTIDLQNVSIKNDKISVSAWWFHGAGREKIHFSVLAYPVITQDGEELDIIDGEDTLLRKTDYGVDSKIDIEYELIDDTTPVEIKFKTTEDNPEEESVIVDIE